MKGLYSVTRDTQKELSEIFGYTISPSEIGIKDLNRNRGTGKIGGIIDPEKGSIIYDMGTLLSGGKRALAAIVHEIIHVYLIPFGLPPDVEEGYASMLTERLTGYADRGYKGLREKMKVVYNKLGNAIFEPYNSQTITKTFKEIPY